MIIQCTDGDITIQVTERQQQSSLSGRENSVYDTALRICGQSEELQIASGADSPIPAQDALIAAFGMMLLRCGTVAVVRESRKVLLDKARKVFCP